MSKIKTAIKQLRTDRGEFMASIISNFFRWLPDVTYLKLLYRFKMGLRLNLKNPQTFTEKLQWRAYVLSGNTRQTHQRDD